MGDLLRKTELDFFRGLRRRSFSPDHENQEVLAQICEEMRKMGIEEPDDLETGPTPDDAQGTFQESPRN